MISLFQSLPSAMPSLRCFESRKELLARAFSRMKVAVPAVLKPRDPARREACRFDFLLFILTYFPEAIFNNPNRFHFRFIAELQRLALSPIKDTKAVAAPRGVGKSMLVQLWDIWRICYKHRNVMLWVCVNMTKATERLEFVETQFLKNDMLHQDFPELCQPVRDFGGDARAAHPYTWMTEKASFANGCWSICCGIDGAILGTLIEGMRLDLVVIDDPEDSDTVRSDTETAKRRNRIEKEICYLAEMGGRCSIVMITTIRGVDCLSQEYTDNDRRPDWRGEVYRAIEKFPDRTDLWDAYVALVGPKTDAEQPKVDSLPDESAAAGILGIDPIVFAAHNDRRRFGLRYYAAKKNEMDAGAAVLDPVRLPLHEFYYEVSKSKAAAYSELQNDPLQAENVTTLQLTIEEVRSRAIRQKARVVPKWMKSGLMTVDIGLMRMHWELDAYDDGFRSSHLVEYGIQETHINESGKYDLARGSEAIRSMLREEAIRNALEELDKRASAGWRYDSNTMLFPLYIGVDIGGAADKDAWQDVVLPFCREKYPRWIPMKGQYPWRDEVVERAAGRNFIFEDIKRNPFGRMDWNTNFYRTQMYNAFKVPLLFDDHGVPQIGCRTLHEEDVGGGHGLEEYARHMVAERYIEEYFEGKDAAKSIVKRWVVKHRNNHLFDTGSMQWALADLARIMVAQSRQLPPAQPEPVKEMGRRRERY